MLKRKRLKQGVTLGLLIVIAFLVPVTVEAEGLKDGLNFSYYNEIPKNQISEATYFKLLMNPNQEQTVITHVKNEVDEEITVQVLVRNATTNSQGMIDFNVQNKNSGPKGVLRLTDMIEVPSQIKLAPGENKELAIKIKTPKDSFKGTVLGAIRLQELEKDKERDEKVTSMSIENTYSYVYSMSLTEEKEMPKPNFSENASFAKKDNVYISYNNIEPVIVNNMRVEASLMKEDSDEVIADLSVKDYSMAPHSRIDIPVEESSKLEVGKYRTKTKVSVGKQTWNFSNNFEITNEDLKSGDRTIATDLKEKSISWVMIAVVTLSFIGVSGGVYYIISKQKTIKK